MEFILKELASADKLHAMKLAPAPNNNKENAVSKYWSILQNANDSWDGKSSCPDSAREWSDSSQEKSLSVKHHRDKKTEWKEQQEQQEKQQPEQQRFVEQRRAQTQKESSGSGNVQTL